MEVDGGEQRVLRRPVLRQQRGEQAAQHVAAAGGGEAGVAAGVDEIRRLWVGAAHDAAAAFEYDPGVVTRRDLPRRADAVGLYGGGGAGQQTRRFAGVWRHERWRVALFERRLQGV